MDLDLVETVVAVEACGLLLLLSFYSVALVMTIQVLVYSPY